MGFAAMARIGASCLGLAGMAEAGGVATTLQPAGPGVLHPAKGDGVSTQDMAMLEGTTWHWVSFASGAEEFKIAAPDRYTIAFAGNGKVAVRADCNRGAGSATFGAAGAVTFAPMAVTKAMCPPDSYSDRYLRLLSGVVHYSVRDGRLLLELPIDSGSLLFAPAP